jgi:hypothetical protein
VYDFNGSDWTPVGSDIIGQADGDKTGTSVSLSSSGSRLAIGAPANTGSKGCVLVYDLVGTTWNPVKQVIYGKNALDFSGISVSLSSDGSRVAIGAPNNDDGGTDAGHVRVYELTTPTPAPTTAPTPAPTGPTTYSSLKYTLTTSGTINGTFQLTSTIDSNNVTFYNSVQIGSTFVLPPPLYQSVTFTIVSKSTTTLNITGTFSGTVSTPLNLNLTSLTINPKT